MGAVMLTRWGVPLLLWLDDELLPEARHQLDALAGYVAAWRELLLPDTPPGVSVMTQLHTAT